MKIIDTHLHIWDTKNFTLQWLEGEGEVLNRTYTLADYQNALGDSPDYQVESAVYVEVDCAVTDKDKENRFITDCCADTGQLFAGACISGYLNEEDFTEYIERYKSPYIKGVRQVLHVPQALPGTCLGETFIKNVRYLGQNGLLFEGCVRNEELNDLYLLAEACPGTLIVLNHMGIVNPDIIASLSPTQEQLQYKKDWIQNMKNLASLPNVVCKISGLNPAGAWNIDTLRPAVDIAIDSFGEDRVMYASNYPVCNVATGLTAWMESLIEITKPRGPEFQEKLFYDNAKRIYRL